jgi:uncharacterized protein YcaQ
MSSVLNEITLDEARRIALAAQGFGRPRPARPSAQDIAATIRSLGLVQIDCVNVLVPAHYQVLFSRLGPYDRAAFDRVAYGSGEFTEQWAHEASIVPVSTWPLLRHRMNVGRFENWGFMAVVRRHPEYSAWVLQQVRERGPLGAEALPEPEGVERRIPGSWVGTVPRAMLEAHFIQGRLAVTERRPDFSRVFDLSERLIAAEHHGRLVGGEEAQRELLRIASRAHGIGTAKDLADYFRIPVREARPRLDELVETGDLSVVKVHGWREAAYLHSGAVVPARVEAATVLSPFDPLIWTRPRVARLFGFDYRVEIFVPPAKREYGFYVLPFLLGDRLGARVDLKSDRAGRRLMVQGAWAEAGVDAGFVAPPLATELRTLAGWLGLESVAVGRRGNLAQALRRSISTSR